VARANVAASANNVANTINHIGRIGVVGLDGGAVSCAEPRAVVVTVIVVPVPAVTDAGLNDALAPVGRPLAANVTLPGNAPPTVAVAIVKLADWPAVVVCVVVVAVTLKSVIVKFNEFDVPPPGVGFTTVIAAVPDAAMSAAVIAAVNCVELTNVVTRALPFHCATELLMKFVPVSVNVNAALPAPVDVGAITVSVGTGFAALMVNVSGFDVVPAGAPNGFTPPPRFTAGVNTVTEAEPTVAISAAVIAAVNCVALTKVVARLPPFHSTVEVLMKLLPLTVSMNDAPPAIAEFGTSEPNAGTGVVTLNWSESELPPPGAGFRTLTLTTLAVCTSAAVMAAVN
jgi:hypothetical protein